MPVSAAVLAALTTHDVKFTDKNENIRLQNWPSKISDFNIYMDFLSDFLEGVRDFRVVGDPLDASDLCT